MWLNLDASLSKENCQKARDKLIHVVEDIHHCNGAECNLTTLVPCSVCSSIKMLQLEVKFKKCVFCSKCFSLYDAELAPEECGYQACLTSQPCGTDLFLSLRILQEAPDKVFAKDLKVPSPQWTLGKIFPQNKPRLRVPKLVFIAQSLVDWIKWFLNIPQMEEMIHKWKDKFVSQPPESIVDVAQGSLWQTIFPKEPRGHQASMGVIALKCLNLPPRLHYQPTFTYLSRISPGPNQPNRFTISNILGPLVNQLLEFNQGIMIHTPKSPKGRKVIVKLSALIGDVVATHKVAGFMSHSENSFCSWYDITSNQKKELKLGRCQSGQDVHNTSFAYHELASHTKREK
ncbi:hypothetical protein O181_021510 [Austropuccinia psidii MF-1]|uniref:Uncharacterized protein n=1 Tax=Austropuccinia psidii MF-1 TaxID=1389203 RepID=A0A9Q3GX64_9BASI|nr:hypothetical protein [Austropuccinia psidii MF-1]